MKPIIYAVTCPFPKCMKREIIPLDPMMATADKGTLTRVGSYKCLGCGAVWVRIITDHITTIPGMVPEGGSVQ